ncbi:MAG: type II toxin-antitoxin system HicB family antitoxin [Parcubacteria group bacterium]|nr:type II toxin-antitoxin system HicB family antitoxin [Parcubacteria group bacterium]
MDKPRIKLKTEFFEEDGNIVGLAPQINVSSFGDTLPDARRSLQEAIDLWIEGCMEMGTLEQVLEEDGFERLSDGTWAHRLSLAQEDMTIAIPEKSFA